MQRLARTFSNCLLRLIIKMPRLSFLYVLLNRSFDTEISGIIHAQLSHNMCDDSRNEEAIIYEFRRSIHRLEKGLVSVPFREDFASSYILNTVRVYTKLVSGEFPNYCTDDPLCFWATQVLSCYFNKVKRHPIIDKAKALFASSRKIDRDASMPEYEMREFAIDPMEFHRMIKNRKSVRNFRQCSVPRSIIYSAVDAARYSPSACNRQPFEYRIFDASEDIKLVGALAPGAKSFYQDVPCLVVIVGRLIAFSHPRDRHLIYIDSALSAMVFMLSLHLQGVASCCINWPELYENHLSVKEILGLPEDARVTMMIAVGFPETSVKVPRSEKKKLEQILSYGFIQK